MKLFYERGMTPNREIIMALLGWVMTALSVQACWNDVASRYHTVVRVQEARMACQARGGFYGSQGQAKARCFER